MSDDITFYDEIEGYCGSLSYAPGDTARHRIFAENSGSWTGTRRAVKFSLIAREIGPS